MNSFKPLISIGLQEGRQAPVLNYEEAFENMERVVKIELLISIEKEIQGYKKVICDEMFKLSKGRL